MSAARQASRIASTLPIPSTRRCFGARASPDAAHVEVVLDQRLGLRVVHVETLAHGLFAIVVALDQILAGDVILGRSLRRIEPDVISAPRSGMHAPPAHPLDDRRVGHVDFQDVVERDGGVLHRVGLRNRSREAVEQVALRAIRGLQPLAHEPDDDVVGHQAAGIHDLFRGEAERRARLERGAQHVPGRDLRNAVRPGDEGGLRAFAGARGTEEDETHGRSRVDAAERALRCAEIRTRRRRGDRDGRPFSRELCGLTVDGSIGAQSSVYCAPTLAIPCGLIRS